MDKREIIKILKNGGVGIFPTDTIYGILGRADLPETVSRIIRLKERSQGNPFIIQLGEIKQLEVFRINAENYKDIFRKYWPGPVSIILPVDGFEYLHQGQNSLAFRLPSNDDFKNLLKKTGPLISTSANPKGKEYAKTIEQAKDYFGSEVDFYYDTGKIDGKPSKILKIENGKELILRD